MSVVSMRKVKVVLVGRNAVGKTSCAMRFTRNMFAHRYISTIGCDYYIKSLDWKGIDHKLVIHDIGGQVEFENLRRKHVENADLAIITFALDNPDTYDISEFVKDYDGFERKPVFVIAGNKLDLVDKHALDLHVPEAIARDLGTSVMLVSAKENVNVTELFASGIERLATSTTRDA